MTFLRKCCFAMVLGLFAVWGCSDNPSAPKPPQKTGWTLYPDTMNLAILVSDFSTYKFEVGALDYYPPCDSCDRDSLPFEAIFNPPFDIGDYTFKYTETGDTLLYATTIWMGTGKIKYPVRFFDADQYVVLPTSSPPPISLQYFFVGHFLAEADTAWQNVNSLDIVREFSKSEYRVGVFLYIPGSSSIQWDLVK